MEKELIRLAQIFEPFTTLYVVGGYVRNKLLALPVFDIDITSALTPDEVEYALAGTEFTLKMINPSLGTLLIIGKDGSYEHTSFRTESYVLGEHIPKESSFVNDIYIDASRRDFTINCIYLDILRNEYTDPYKGRRDIRRHVIRAVPRERSIFEDDGLRLMRLVRLACEFDLTITTKTYQSARDHAKNICDISPERIRAELDKIFVSDNKYKLKTCKGSVVRGINLLGCMGILERIFERVKLFNVIWKCLPAVGANKLLAFAVDLYNINGGNIDDFVNNSFGEIGLRYDNDTLRLLKRTISASQEFNYMEDNKWLLTYYDIALDVLPIMRPLSRTHWRRMAKLYNSKLSVNAPSTLKNLNITTKEILSIRPELKGKEISNVLNKLLLIAFTDPRMNENTILVELVKGTK